MDLATFERESLRNRQGYEAVRDRVRLEYHGKYVALANGKIIGAASTFDSGVANSLGQGAAEKQVIT